MKKFIPLVVIPLIAVFFIAFLNEADATRGGLLRSLFSGQQQQRQHQQQIVFRNSPFGVQALRVNVQDQNRRRTPLRDLFSRNQNQNRNRNRNDINQLFFAANLVAAPIVAQADQAFLITPRVSGLNIAQPVSASGGFLAFQQPPQFIVNPAYVDPSLRAVRQFATPGFIPAQAINVPVYQPPQLLAFTDNCRRFTRRRF